MSMTVAFENVFKVLCVKKMLALLMNFPILNLSRHLNLPGRDSLKFAFKWHPALVMDAKV